jgi:uncharacterized membrane protein
MSDETALDPVDSVSGGRQGVMPTIIYVLYIAAAFTGVPWLIGLLLAYVSKGEAGDVAATHYRYQIRTFWLGLLYAIIGGVTMVFGIGVFICLFTWVWAIVRSVKGLGWYNDGLEVPNPGTLLW